jgi:hypothetical protein
MSLSNVAVVVIIQNASTRKLNISNKNNNNKKNRMPILQADILKTSITFTFIQIYILQHTITSLP